MTKIFLKTVPDNLSVTDAFVQMVQKAVGAKNLAATRKLAAKESPVPFQVPFKQNADKASSDPADDPYVHFFGIAQIPHKLAKQLTESDTPSKVVHAEINDNPKKYTKSLLKYFRPGKHDNTPHFLVDVREINKKKRYWAFRFIYTEASFNIAKKVNVEFKQAVIPAKEKVAAPQKKTPVASKTAGKSSSAKSGDITVTTASGDKLVKINLSNIDLYWSTLQSVFTLLDEKIKFYKIEMDTPFSPMYYAAEIKKLSGVLAEEIKQLPTAPPKKKKSTKAPKSDPRVTLLFSGDYKEIKSIEYEGQQTDKKITAALFENQTTNALIGSLSILYDVYSTKSSVQGGVTSVFLAPDEIKSFLNQYIIPKPFITTSVVTEKIIEKFILGDTRLLDDTLYNAYRVPGESEEDGGGEFKARFKMQMNEQIGQQYEQIGDFLGIQFGAGKFKEIDDMDDLYNQLLDHIDVEDLIALSAKCLLKLLPIEEVLDEICDGVLEEFDKHQEKIIQALEKMEDGDGKVLAEELTEIYFHFIDGAVEYTGQIASGLIKETAELAKESAFASTWSSPTKYAKIYDKNESQLDKLLELYADPKTENSIAAKIARNQRKLDKLDDIIFNAEQRLKPFGTDIPPQEAKALSGYGLERAKIKTRMGELTSLRNSIGDKITLLEMIKEALPALMLLSPSLTDPQKIALVKKYRNSFPKALKPPAGDITKKVLANLSTAALKLLNGKKVGNLNLKSKSPPSEILTLQQTGVLFTFGGYNEFTKGEKKKPFRSNLKHLQNLYTAIGKYSDSAVDTSKFNDFGTKTKDEVLNELFKKGSRKRYLLCLAIYSAIPAAAYMIATLIEDPVGTARYLAKQGKQIAKGLARRYEIFMRTDYPVWDILSVLKESAIQIGKNLGRDLILTGIMYTLKVINELCSDPESEQKNAPYDPIGAIDLSSFINKSIINGKQTDSLENSSSFRRASSLGISLTEYTKILSVLSSTFTIREMNALLKGRATDKLYEKALATLQELEFIKDTDFEQFYLNKPGIRIFFDILGKDINPALLAQAQTNFDKEKTVLLSICFGTDDNILAAELSKHLSPEQLKRALAERAAMPGALVKKLSKNLGDVLGPPIEQDLLCSDTNDGIMLYEDAQRHTAGVIGDTLFGALEKSFERDVSQVKNIYKESSRVFRDSQLFGKSKDNQLGNLSNPAIGDTKQGAALVASMNKKNKNLNFVANALLVSAQSKWDQIKFTREKDGSIIYNDVIEFPDLEGVQALHASPPKADLPLGASQIEQSAANAAALQKAISSLVGEKTGISFLYDPANDDFNTNLVMGTITPDSWAPDEELGEKLTAQALADAKQQHADTEASGDDALNVGFPWYVTEDPDDGPTTIKKAEFDESNVEAPEIPQKLIPEHMEVIAETFTKKDSPETALEESVLNTLGKGGTGSPHAEQSAKAVLERVKNCDIYMVFLNSIFKEAYANAFKGGIFERSVFNEVVFNKKIGLKDCFLGFLNKDLLNTQMQNLAKKLACIDIDSPTRTPVNIATIKVALDSLVRIIALKEIMKSLFVYNTFTSELIYDGEDSFFDTFLTARLEETFREQGEIDINTEVIQQYITDIMKVIYSDDTLTDEQAFGIIKTTQLNFAKRLLFEIMPPSVSFPELNKSHSYQLVQDTESAAAADDGTELNITLKNVGIADKLQLIQNDPLTLYIKARQMEHITPIEFISDSDLEPDQDKKRPPRPPISNILFKRHGDPTVTVKYYNHTNMAMEETTELKTLLQGNTSGMALEEMVKFDHKADFWENMSLPQQENFKAFLDDISTHLPRTDIWKLLYDTKLICLFPQLTKIVDSWNPENTGPALQLPSGGFFDMFMYNRDPSYPAATDNPDLEWALSGKFYRSDLQNFINKFNDAPNTAPKPAISPAGTWGSANTDFFTWFYKKPVSEIIKISTVISLNGYVDIEALDTYTAFNTQIDPREALEEKIGELEFEEAGTRYFTFPVQEAIEMIPADISWREFFMQIDKNRVKKSSFYNRFTKEEVFKEGAYNLNEVLFMSGIYYGRDIFSYVAGLKAITGLNVINESVLSEYVYESTDWFNIRGNVVSKEQILDHVDRAGGPLLEGVDNADFSSDPLFHEDPYAYLTPGSYYSLTENGEWWFESDGSPKKNPDNILPARPDIYTSIRGYSLEGGVYWDDKVVVGTFDAINPVNGLRTTLPKYIRVNQRYHLQQNSTEQMSSGTRPFDLQEIKDRAAYWWSIWIDKMNYGSNSIAVESPTSERDYDKSIALQGVRDTWFGGGAGKVVYVPNNSGNGPWNPWDAWINIKYRDGYPISAANAPTRALQTLQYRNFGPWGPDKEIPMSQYDQIKYRLTVPDRLLSALRVGTNAYKWVYSSGAQYPSPDGEEGSAHERPDWDQLTCYGFRTLEEYLTALNEVKHLIWRYALQELYDITPGDDHHYNVLEYSSGWLDMDWGWQCWVNRWNNTIKYDKHLQNLVWQGPASTLGSYDEPQMQSFLDPVLTPSESKEWENKWPGTTFTAGVWWDSEDINKRPVGFGRNQQGGLSKYRNPWSPTGQYPGNKAGNADLWNKGSIFGGLASVEQKWKTVPLDGVILFNMYNVFEKISQTYGTHAHTPDDPHGWESIRNPGIDNLLQSFFIKEQFTIIAMQQRLLAEKNYPELDKVFDNSIRIASEILIAAMASAQGDFRPVRHGSSSRDEYTFAEAMDDIYEFGKLIVKAVITATANTVDPTWPTPWFGPGPFTPFGVIAKHMHSPDEEEEQPGRPLTFVPPIYKQCEDKLDKQIDLLAKITKNEKPK